MKMIAVVVEGQTEEAFIKNVLNEYLASRGIFITPTVPKTSSTPAGSHKGGAPWRRYHELSVTLAHEAHWDAVGILMDFYGVPRDIPGYSSTGSGTAYRDELLAAISADLNTRRVLPHLILHEFETLVLAAIACGARASLTPAQREAIVHQIAECHDDVEAGNGARDTSPSHRLQAACDSYVKTATGISLLREAPFDDVLDRCPTFAGWLHELLDRAGVTS